MLLVICRVADALAAALMSHVIFNFNLEEWRWSTVRGPQLSVLASTPVMELLLLRLALGAQQWTLQQQQSPQQQRWSPPTQHQHAQQQPGYEQLLLALGTPSADIATVCAVGRGNFLSATTCIIAALRIDWKLGVGGMGQVCSNTAGTQSSCASSSSSSGSGSHSSGAASRQGSSSSNNPHGTAFLPSGAHLPVLHTLLESLLLPHHDMAFAWVEDVQLASAVLADWGTAAAGIVFRVACSQLLPLVLQLAPAVFAVVNKYSTERCVPAALKPAGDDSKLLGSFGMLLFSLVDSPELFLAGNPRCLT